MKTIISLWPLPSRIERPRQAPIKVHTIPAADMDGFIRHVVNDATETDYMGGGRYAEQLVRAEELANDLVGEVSRFRCGETGNVGIYVSDIDNPTDEQVLASPQYERALAEQNVLMRNIINQARALFADPLTKKAIGKIHHTAAEYLKVEGEEWQGALMHRGATRPCPYCARNIPVAASICSGCNNIVNAEAHARTKQRIQNQIEAIAQQAQLEESNGGSALRPANRPPVKKELASV